MQIIAVPCLKDNFAYLIIDEASQTAAVVDPGQSGPVLEAVAAANVKLTAVWATHHHPDHVGGITGLLETGPLEVVAFHTDAGRIPQATRLVDDGDTVDIGEIQAQVIHNPGHTLGAISFWLSDHRAIFTGDTLFGGGCGRMFEGTPEMMHASLMRLAALPSDTRIYFGHEYTAANLAFGQTVEPDNSAIKNRRQNVVTATEAGKHSTPSLLQHELATNPFLRCAHKDIIAAARRSNEQRQLPAAQNASEVFASLRSWKDSFAG
jgi:hydroxyacylglutathione hydrolase